MESKFIQKKIVQWPIGRLKPHSRQCHLFTDLTPIQLQQLAESLEKDGLVCPVEITPKGVIICGHQRVMAAKLLGWDRIACWVRSDLAEQGEEAVFDRMTSDNLGRRQLTRMGIGRAYLLLHERHYSGWQAKQQVAGDLRDYIGKMLDVDGTTAERWAKLAQLPIEFEPLIESGVLTQQIAHKILKSRLPMDQIEQLGQELTKLSTSEGSRKEKKMMVQQAVAAKIGSLTVKSPQAPSDWLPKLFRDLGQALADLPAPMASAVSKLVNHHGEQIAIKSIQRKFSVSLKAFAQMELDENSRDKIKQGALLLLGVLAATENATAE